MSSEQITGGFDLSYPLMSKPSESSRKVSSVRVHVPCEKMTGGIDLTWPLMSRRPEDQQHEQGERIKKAA